ncbi:hypothetical protein UlMin_007569 [Ulmus minor]
MASIPDHFYSDYQFPPSEFSGMVIPNLPNGRNGGGVMWGNSDQEDWMGNTNPFVYGNSDGSLVDSGLSSSPPESSFGTTSSLMVSSFPEQIGLPDGVVPSLCDYSCMQGLHGISGVDQSFNGGYQLPLDGYDPDFHSVSLPGAGSNWGMQSNYQMHANEESNMLKVSRYTEEERKERIERYLKKRNQRNFNKTIKYACRKTLADRRVRVRGRFARNTNELCHNNQEMVAKKNVEDNIPKDIDLCCENNAVQMKYDEDDWLQEIALCCWVNGGSIL